MAWNTGNGYSSGTALTAAMLNGIGNDFRTWGGNVDAGANELTNLLATRFTSLGGVKGTGNAYNSAFGSCGILRVIETGDIRRIVAVGYDPSLEMGFVQAGLNGVAYKPMLVNPNGGGVSINTATAPISAMRVGGIQNYGSNAAAISAGLTVGDTYRNGDNFCIVH